MKLQQIFAKPVTRAIEGVIKADDESSLYIELSEYVLTDEIARRLDHFLDAYTDYVGANGAWISGFFGSGKSHLLKMLALLLENRTVDGSSALELFLPKIREDDQFLRAKLKQAVAIPSRSILFNIDQKADVISKAQVDALLSVFVKVFNETCGYYGKQGYIAQFERDLDSRGELDAFRQAYQEQAGKPWERGREQVVLESANVAKAYAKVTGGDPDHARGLLDKYRSEYRVSIEDFSNQVKDWLDQQPANFRLNFFVDEVGQYIADNVKLMTNLQTVAESLATKCGGRAWVIVTAQEDMDSVLGDMSRQQSNDFSKIQARFANRLKLTSADVAEVIQKRLLSKNEQGDNLLRSVYAAQSNNFGTLFDFAGRGVSYRNFRDEAHFINSYPFVPYQFELFQAAIRGLSDHNGFEGKANSVGERSMLGVFRDVAIAIQDEPVGQLATFDRMFEGIRGTLKAGIQTMVHTAERNLDDAFAVRVLKALFLVKYVKQFKATPRNLAVLLLDRFDADIPALSKQLQTALDTLEHQTYIQRTGDEYEYLTDEEKDIEKEIKNTEVEAADLAKLLDELFFDGVIRQRKIRYDNGQDYAYARKLDDQLFGRDQELAIHIITPLAADFDNIEQQRMASMGRDELRVVLPADARFMQDLMLFKRTEKYIRQESGTQHDTVRRILQAKSEHNLRRRDELQSRAAELLGRATLIISAGDVSATSSDGQTRVITGFHQLVEKTYIHLRMLRPDTAYAEADVGKWLRLAEGSLPGTGAGNLGEPEQELYNHIRQSGQTGVRASVKSLLDRFQHKPYGWPYAAVLCHLALLCGAGRVEVRRDSNILQGDALEQALRNTQAHIHLMLEPQATYTHAQVRRLKDFYTELFDRPPSSTDARPLAQETQEGLRTLHARLAALHAQAGDYPFLASLADSLAQLQALAEKQPSWLLTDLGAAGDDLLDAKEQLLDPITRFMDGAQRGLLDQVRNFLRQQQDNLPYVQDTGTDAIDALLASNRPWQGNLLQQALQQVKTLRQGVDQQLAAARRAASAQLEQLAQRLQQLYCWDQLDPALQQNLLAEFTVLQQSLAQQTSIAVVRDTVPRFEDSRYPQLLQQAEASATPATPLQAQEASEAQETQKAQAAQKTQRAPVVPARSIPVAYANPWVSSEADLDDYLAKQRAAWLQEIQAGKRIRI